MRHTYVDLICQRVYQMTAGYEDCNDANHLRIDPALRLALGKDAEYAASQSMLSRLENEILGNEKGMAALDETLQRSIDALLRKKGKERLILDMDSTEDPAHGKQEGSLTTFRRFLVHNFQKSIPKLPACSSLTIEKRWQE